MRKNNGCKTEHKNGPTEDCGSFGQDMHTSIGYKRPHCSAQDNEPVIRNISDFYDSLFLSTGFEHLLHQDLTNLLYKIMKMP